MLLPVSSRAYVARPSQTTHTQGAGVDRPARPVGGRFSTPGHMYVYNATPNNVYTTCLAFFQDRQTRARRGTAGRARPTEASKRPRPARRSLTDPRALSQHIEISCLRSALT